MPFFRLNWKKTNALDMLTWSLCFQRSHYIYPHFQSLPRPYVNLQLQTIPRYNKIKGSRQHNQHRFFFSFFLLSGRALFIKEDHSLPREWEAREKKTQNQTPCTCSLVGTSTCAFLIHVLTYRTPRSRPGYFTPKNKGFTAIENVSKRQRDSTRAEKDE